jgi:hypothetical protein
MSEQSLHSGGARTFSFGALVRTRKMYTSREVVPVAFNRSDSLFAVFHASKAAVRLALLREFPLALVNNQG